MNDERFITHIEIAERMNLNPAHVRDRLRRRPGFPAAYQFGGARRWREDEIEDWIESQRRSRPGRRAA